MLEALRASTPILFTQQMVVMPVGKMGMMVMMLTQTGSPLGIDRVEMGGPVPQVARGAPLSKSITRPPSCPAPRAAGAKAASQARGLAMPLWEEAEGRVIMAAAEQ